MGRLHKLNVIIKVINISRNDRFILALILFI